MNYNYIYSSSRTVYIHPSILSRQAMASKYSKLFCGNIVVCFFFFCYFVGTPALCVNNETDALALLAFKAAIDSDPLLALSSWNETVHFCSWRGVTCSRRHVDRVVAIVLISRGLEGSLSPHLGNLSFLRSINLKNNSFHGPIPEEIGHLTRLEFVEFSNNSFGGEIPGNLSHCKNLNYLNLIDNDLTGVIIPEIGSLAKLEALGLTGNRLSGTIPPFIGNLTNLAVLSLAKCGLQGEIPESLVQLQRMRWLTLAENSLTGEIPFGLYNISSMETFSFGYNQLQGTIPSDIGFTLPKLRILDFGYNHFTGTLPASLLNSSLIERINLSSNNFTGKMIQDFGRLSALQVLIASYNNLEGDINTMISSLTNCTSLVVLGLSGNLLSGSLPDSIANLSSFLWFLSIDGNQLNGSIPSSIGNLVSLTQLSLGYNDLKGPIPLSIGKLHKLQEIYLGANRLTNEIPSSFGNLTLLNHLDLGRNGFYGNIPQSLSNCSKLLSLDLSQNNLHGSIPPEIMRLSTISISFNLAYNVLTGTIPLEVGFLRNLGNLDLSHNRLLGPIPNSLGSCVMLERLHLESNSLNGGIPDRLSALRGLQDLDLSRNNLSGTIPRFLVEFRLVNLNLSFNRLEGGVPTLGVFQNESAISLEGNGDLCGGVAKLKLPPCSSASKKKHFPTVWKILIPATGAICFALSAFFYMIMHRRRTSQKIQNPMALLGAEFLRLSYADLLKATGGFSEANLLGAGRFGSVYRGIFDDERTVVAVKVLNLNIRGASKSIISECNALRCIRHRNLVKILSICLSTDFQGEDFKALVYEFMANGSLEKWLHQNLEEESRILSAVQRLNIAINIASAVEYLHYGTDSTIVHGDLKPSNILLDENMIAHVGDFGLAKIISNISRNCSSQGSSSASIRGTIGYIAPEYGMSDVISTQGDVYSYGILLLEMFTNRRPTSDAFEGHINLQNFVSSALPDHAMEAVDPFLHQELNIDDKYWDCMVSILSIGVRCSKELPRDRMSMANVVNELNKIRNVFVADSRN